MRTYSQCFCELDIGMRRLGLICEWRETVTKLLKKLRPSGRSGIILKVFDHPECKKHQLGYSFCAKSAFSNPRTKGKMPTEEGIAGQTTRNKVCTS
jgi:hypothetical protein